MSDAWLHEPDEVGETPMSRSLKSGHRPAISLIMTIAEEPDTADEDPIFEACRESKVSAVRRMLEDGTDINTVDGYGLTPLHWATITGCMDLAKLLLNRGAHVNPRDENASDLTPTALAGWLDYDEMKELLSDHGGLM